MLRSLAPIFFALATYMAFSTSGRAQHTERTLDEVKAEAVRRAEVGGYPLIGIDPADVQEAFKSIHTRNPDEWATAFMDVANKYENEAKSLGKTDPAKANADYIRAWRLYSFGRWPYPSSPKKQEPNRLIDVFTKTGSSEIESCGRRCAIAPLLSESIAHHGGSQMDYAEKICPRTHRS